VAIQLAARPSSWYWLLPPEPTQTALSGQDSKRQAPLEELDFRVREEVREPLPPDVFRAVADEASPAEGTAAAVPATDRDRHQPPKGVDGESQTAPVAVDPGILPALLAGIEDNTLGVRRVEVDAYHQMLATVHRLPDDVRRQEADTDVAFTVI